ncbi:hypothetical protein SDC9_160169 [bioreactor metagenome]|uniref:Polymer-forming cytoskeletal n=1 Tax=bioreactor metagenome TaxID=1076179 RepID=A0A645FHM5_9ZZZZ
MKWGFVMGTKENFNQAMHEVFPFYKNAKGSDAGEINSSSLAEKPDGKNEIKRKDPILFRSNYDPLMQQSLETTYVSKDTKITGKIVSKSNLDICEDVLGDLESQNSIKISGKVEGNIIGKNIEINNAVIKGNIHASERLHIVNQSEIVGDLFANEIELNSIINGNITVKKGINIQKDTKIVGDITAQTIDIEKGAIVKSMLNIAGEMKVPDENLIE